MNGKLTKTQTLLMLIALFLSNICTMGEMVIVPIIADLYEVFPDPMLVNFFMSFPAVVGLVFCFIGGRLADKYNKKLLLVFGYGLFTVSSIFGATFVNIYYMLFMRVLTYVAWGFTSTASIGIIAEYYVDTEKRGKVIGVYNAAMAAIGSTLSFVGGFLALNGWQSVYKAYWISVPVLLMLIFCIPRVTSTQTQENVSEGSKESKKDVPKGWAKNLIPLCAGFLFSAMCYYVIVYMVSLYVTDTGVGDAAFTGLLSSIGTITSALMGIAFGFIYARLADKTSLPSYLILAVGFLLMYMFPSAGMIMFACALMGGAWGNIYSYFFTHCTVIVPDEMQGTSVGIIQVVNSLAVMVMPYSITFLKSAMNTENIRDTFFVYAIILAIVFVLGLLLKLRPKQM